MKRLWLLFFYVSLFVFPFGQLTRLVLPFLPQVKIHLLDLLVFLFNLAWLLHFLFRQRSSVPKIFQRFVPFLAIATVSLLWQLLKFKSLELLPAALYLLRFGNFLLLFWSARDFLNTFKLPLVKYLLWEGLVVAILALGQYLFLPDTRFLFNLGWDEHYFRAIGTFLDPSFTGLILCLAIIVWLTELAGQKKKLFFWLNGLVMLIALGLSFSRIIYLSFSLTLTLFFWLRGKRRILAAAIIVFCLLIFLLPKPGGEGVNLWRISSLQAKIGDYQHVGEIIKKNFWLGTGFNNYRLTQKNLNYIMEEDWQLTNAGAGADNSFLFVWATTGIFGFLAFLYAWFYLLKQSWARYKKSEPGQRLFLSCLVLSLGAFSFNSLFYPWVMFWLGLLVAEFTVEN